MELSIPVPVPELQNVIPAHPWRHSWDETCFFTNTPNGAYYTRPSVSIVKVALTVDGAQIINKLSRRPEAQSNPAFLGNDDQPHNISRPIYFIFKIHWDAWMGSSSCHPLGSTNVILWQIMSHSIGTGGHKKTDEFSEKFQIDFAPPLIFFYILL